MTKKVRTILFLIFLFLFTLIAPLAIFYSQGYRLDFEAKKITQTGGLFLKVLPRQVDIYIHELQPTHRPIMKKTDFFFGSALIENLLPKKYKVEVKKEGYHTWEKDLEIKKRGVTEVKNIILFPKNPDFTILTRSVETFWPSPDEKKIIIKEGNPPAGGWTLKLYDLEKNIKSHLLTEKDIYSNGADLLNLEFSKNSKEIALEVGVREELKYFTFELDQFPIALKEKRPSPVSEEVATQLAQNGNLYYLDNSGNLFKNEEKLTERPFPVKSETEYTLDIFQNFIFLREGQNLYLFSSESKSFEKFFEGVRDLKISPDSKKLVYFSDYEIWILFLKEKSEQPQKKVGQSLLVVRLSEKITDGSWLNSDYLVFVVGNKIKISEIDERDRINLIDFSEFEKPETFFSQNSKRLFIFSQGNIYTSGPLF